MHKETLVKHPWYNLLPLCLIVMGGESNKMHQGGNYQDFLKWGRCF